MNIFDWDNETDCDAKTSASANSCVQGCGWDKSSTLKPWEAMSRWLAEFGAKGNADRASKVFLLLNYFSTTNVFSRVELPTIIRSLLREENHLLDVMNERKQQKKEKMQQQKATPPRNGGVNFYCSIFSFFCCFVCCCGSVVVTESWPTVTRSCCCGDAVDVFLR